MPNDSEIDTTLVRQLADILKETELSEIEVERGELKIRVARELTVAAGPVTYAAAPAPAAARHRPPPPPRPCRATRPLSSPARAEEVKSPLVGTVYLQASPEAPPFVNIATR